MDSGNISDATGLRKLDVIFPVMAKAGYAAIGVGENDVRLGADFYQKAAASKLAVIDTSPVADKSTLPYLIKDVGGVRVGIMSFNVPRPDVTVNDMELRKMRFITLKEVRGKCDVLILLDQAGIADHDWLDRNGPRIGAPDIVIGGVGHSIPYDEQVVARTHIMPPLLDAKEMGLIDLEVTPGQEPKTTFKRVMLDQNFAEDPVVSKVVHEAMGNWVPPTGEQPPPPGPVDKPYYEVRLCKVCHQKQYEQWSQTKHAVALKTLVDQNRATEDCLPCHSEGFRARNRYIPQTTDFAGVECQTCHSSSLPHGLERKNQQTRAMVSHKLCLDCHTKDRSPTYDEKTYFPKIVHAGTISGPAVANTSPAH